ncbi:calmodulin-regulated spectrin-associated protein 3 isoform X2 [Polypterus senegalus]|uniref:calmodulin-regulated spectrin-associated protein 3 isoform X2 n=1 Tax=Polypterus senegalus TaxID=55291 RepID=UPI00196321FE|nr:calmodulin-regulated spectrin-associated protein 3 isoform X2 [Polypterus senegalus]
MVDSNAMRKTFLVPEIKPLDQYDFNRAKICASLTWVFSRCYGSAENIPEELREPFYIDQYEQEHIKPPVIRLLQSSDLYCQVCRLALLGDREEQDSLDTMPRDNAAVLQLLSQKGLQPLDQEHAVTEADLRHKPIKMSAHLALIDMLMVGFATKAMSLMKMPSNVEPLSSMGLAAWECAVVFWVNKLIQKLRLNSEREHQQRQQPGADIQAQQSCPTRWYWKLVPIRYRKDKVMPKQTPIFPLVSSSKDLSNGCAIAAIIHFYCPNSLRLEDVCLKETMSVADSLYNLQVVQEFCQDCLGGCCPLALEDLLYAPPALKVNIMTFMAELFWWFEVRKPEVVCPRETLDLQDMSDIAECVSPTSCNNNSGSPSFIFKQPFLPIPTPQSPGRSVPGSLTQSTSLPHVEGVGKATWTKKQLSRPLSQAVSFSIPFGLDSDVDIVMGNPVAMTRSISSDSLNPNVFQLPETVTRATYTPPEDVSAFLEKGNGDGAVTGQTSQSRPPSSQRASWGTQTAPSRIRAEKDLPVENGLTDDHNKYTDLPTIEEALQIIHNEGKLEPRLLPEGAADGFYLHSPDVMEESGSGRHGDNSPRLSSSAPTKPGMMYRVHDDMAPSSEKEKRPRRTSEGSRISRDDDSVLRDNSLDSDLSEEFSKHHQAGRDCLDAKDDSTSGSSSLSSQPESNPASSTSPSIKMTSFAERKKKVATTEPQKDTTEPKMITWAQKSEESPSKSPALNTEMSELGARLEEKRRAIEAQKKRIEAIFAKHRQRLGKSAFLQLKKREEGSQPEGEADASSTEEVPKLSLEERLSRIGDEEERETPSPLDSTTSKLVDDELPNKIRSEKQVRFSPEIGKEKIDDASLGEYNKAVTKLNAALNSLQSDMQRLAEQQKQLMRKKTNQAWVIPASPKPTAAAPPLPSQRISRDFQSSRSVDLSSSSPSPSPSRKPANTSNTSLSVPKSPQPAHKRPQSSTPKSPKHARPVDLKFPPLTRVLTPPQNVDNLPHLRKFSPSQFPIQTSSSFNIGGTEDNQNGSRGQKPVGPIPKPLAVEDDSSETGSSEDPLLSLDADGNIRPVGPVGFPKKEPGTGSSSGAPSECSFDSDFQPSLNGKRTSLIEISLSSLQVPDEEDIEEGQEAFSDSMSDQTDSELKPGVGFFFKEDALSQDEMARRQAALLAKQQKRAEEMKKRKQWQEQEKESRLQDEETKSQPEEKEVVTRRGDFTRREHERRQQLKIMEDLDKVLRQKPQTVRAVKKQRPKTVCRDDSVLSRSPVKGLLGSKLSKIYSQSTLSLSTMANDTGSLKKSPRADSPSGLMSPSRLLSSQNGERDWENGSTASSPASIPEHTGPKLYKEPSLKSNKFIIHNALSRCCLAGKVNEPQKNKILEDMDKSKANHFLILFRDSSCQFRAVYTMNPETKEMVRLTGVGPRIITGAMVDSIYKYNSDRKQFTTIPSKTMSMSVDAVTIQSHFWQSKRPGTPKKPGTPK